MEISSFKTVFTIFCIILSGAWAYMIWIVKEIKNICKERNKLKEDELNYYINRFRTFESQIECTEKSVNIWKKTIDMIRLELEKTKNDLEMTLSERNDLTNKLEDSISKLEELKLSMDPLLIQVPEKHDIF